MEKILELVADLKERVLHGAAGAHRANVSVPYITEYHFQSVNTSWRQSFVLEEITDIWPTNT